MNNDVKKKINLKWQMIIKPDLCEIKPWGGFQEKGRQI